MDENNQILDVTYGNFSCRLEGFEDSVETMKTVVTFFHDLAGHERFMDVPPLAPDMDTLARLTEEQSGQPVEIEGEGHTVSLRALPDADDDDLMDDVAALEDELEDEADLVADDDYDDDAGDDDVSEDDDYDVDASVADKLERIRAVVDGGPDTDADDFAEDLGEDDAATAAASPLSQRLAELAQRNTDLMADDTAAAAANEDTAGDSLRDVFEDTAEEAEDESLEALDDDINAFDDLEVEAEEAASDTEIDTDPIAAEADDLEEQVDQILAADTPADEFEITEALDDDKAADDASDLSPLVLTPGDAATDTAGDNDAAADTSDDDEEFDLQKEVAKVEAEIAARQQNGVARHGLPRSVEDAMSRIMSQTDQHLNQPESRRHRDAFAQLKAAVAATEAARQLGDKGAETVDPDEVFKDDLGAHDAEEKERSQAIASAPLKLVPSQKVEPEAEADAEVEVPQKPEPVKTRFIEPAVEEAAQEAKTQPADAKPLDAASERLRQIAALKEADGQTEAAGFAEFAAAHGATDLVDKLEAAGAFICFVEGAADFSRPQVMKVVQSASSEEITREDGLRCFGRLLRQARLIKLPNGRFQVAENTQYRPDGDKAAQG